MIRGIQFKRINIEIPGNEDFNRIMLIGEYLLIPIKSGLFDYLPEEFKSTYDFKYGRLDPCKPVGLTDPQYEALQKTNSQLGEIQEEALFILKYTGEVDEN